MFEQEALQPSSSAQSSLCPQCGSYIDLKDFKISGTFGRSIQTQGEVIITSKGEVTSAKVACGEAIIEGKLRGNLSCTGTVTVRNRNAVHGTVVNGKPDVPADLTDFKPPPKPDDDDSIPF